MSDLFRVEVVRVSGTTVELAVDVVHPDQQDVPDTRNFALQLLVDAYRRLNGGPVPYSSPGRPVDPRAAKHPRRSLLDELLELEDGKAVAISKAEHDALDDSAATMRAAGVHVLSRSHGGYWKFLVPDPRAFVARADQIVLWVKKTDVPSSGLPKAVLAVEVNDAATLSHLTPGMSFASAAYDWIAFYELGDASADARVDAQHESAGADASIETMPPPARATEREARPPPPTQAGCSRCAAEPRASAGPSGLVLAAFAWLLWLRTRRG